MMVLLISFLAFSPSVSQAAETHAQPKLVLQITVDQLRGDTLTRFGDRFGPGGFRYLLEKGTHFTNTHYKHANTETAPGHATLSHRSLSIPAMALLAMIGLIRTPGLLCITLKTTGITSSVTSHVRTKASPPGIYCLLPSVMNSLSIQPANPVSLVSRPRTVAPFFPVDMQEKRSGIQSVRGEFVTSTYYYDDYPEWVKQWNSEKLANQFKGKTWNLLNNRSTYVAQRSG